ncbi:MAG: hypothetical protein WCO45_05235 [Pseudanabaena sp. ELA607]
MQRNLLLYTLLSMARYTHFFLVEAPPDDLRQGIVNILQSCGLVIAYNTEDYVIAQEPQKTAVAKLVTVEVLIHRSDSDGERTRLTCVSKNAELPLRKLNHCRDIAQYVCRAFQECGKWRVLESASDY